MSDDSIQKQIIQAAQQLFQTYGLQKVTMDDIAKEIGKGRSSLYYYYKSKEEILVAAIEVEMKEIFMEIGHAVDKAPDLEQKVHAYFNTRLKISPKRRVFYNMLDTEDHEQMRKALLNLNREMEVTLLKQILDFGIQKGQLRKMEEKEQDTLILMWLTNMQGFKREMQKMKKSFASLEPAIAMFTYLLLQGFKK